MSRATDNVIVMEHITPRMRITRKWEMPNADTFQVSCIGEFVKSYLRNSKVSIDPFARNCNWATYTNDLAVDTLAQHHMKAHDYLKMLKERGIKSDLIIFDPPYSLRQAKEVYDSVGKFTFEDSQDAGKWTREKSLCYDLLEPEGIFLNFGWNTNGLGRQYGAIIEEILIVAHGGAHNDTLCMAERKISHQANLFEANL